MIRRTFPALLALAWSLPAGAAGTTTDIELLRPTFSPAALPGVDTAILGRQGSLRWGTSLRYVNEPLSVYERPDGYQGAAVEHRLAAHLGISAEVTDGITLRGSLPAAVQFGTDVPKLAPRTLGIGDLSAGARFALKQSPSSHLAIRADLRLPTGTAEAYLGDGGVRLDAGFLATGLVDTFLGPTELLGDAGFTLRGVEDTGYDFILGPELVLSGGALVEPRPRFALGPMVVTRWGLASFLGAAESTGEIGGVVRFTPRTGMQLDVLVSRGMGGGYGSSVASGMAVLTFTKQPPPPEPEAVVVVEVPDVEEEPEPEPEEIEWEEEETVRVTETQIEIRDPIQFAYGSDEILPESIQTLRQVAAILNAEWSIGHVLIEGHASEEGSFEYNYNLSALRAEAVFEALVEAGVHPERLSTRSMGEVEPAEGDVMASRRVEFHIIQRLMAPVEPPSVDKVPWTGQSASFTWPSPPPAPEPPPPPVEPEPTEPEVDLGWLDQPLDVEALEAEIEEMDTDPMDADPDALIEQIEQEQEQEQDEGTDEEVGETLPSEGSPAGETAPTESTEPAPDDLPAPAGPTETAPDDETTPETPAPSEPADVTVPPEAPAPEPTGAPTETPEVTP